MTIFCRLVLFTVAVFFVSHLTLTVHAEEGKYGEWQSSDSRLEEMINELDQIIDEGSQADAAHPAFLKDLQMILDKYRIPTRIAFFADDFADNDFTQDPTWTVSTGTYIIDRYGSLYSSIAIRRPPPVQAEEESGSGGDRGLRIIMGVLDELTKKDSGQAESETGPEQAVIYSKAEIPNSFNLQFTFRSAANWGSTSIGVFQGDDPKSGYHLVYQASPADNRPMQLIKYRYGKPYVVDEILHDSPDLDDGADHIIQLSRLLGGEMVVTVDDIEVLRSSDLSYQDDFNGVVIINNGGSYGYGNIELYRDQ
jgi:hypothetical protein